jgi:LPXTG-site transpeptidase (sortase) family protein
VTIVRNEESLREPALAVEPEAPLVGDEKEPVAGSKRRWTRPVAIVVLAALAALLTVAFFAGPVERIWYRNRQAQLASDMNTPHRGVTRGQAVAVLQIPRLGVNVVVAEGDGPEQLRGGPGHRVASAMPGRRGNTLIMGHRSAWGGPFGRLPNVKKGELIAVQTREKQTIVYKVRSVARVGGTEPNLLRTSKDFCLTLVTGRGGRFSDDRLVVTAVSGTRAKEPGAARAIRAETPGPSLILNLTLLLAVVSFALAVGAAVYLRRRSGILARLVVVVPLLAVGTLCLLLDLDLLLPPLN